MARGRQIEIRLFSDDNNGQKNGTFTGPPPKIRVDPGDTISFDLKVVPDDRYATFSIQFLNGVTPLVDQNGNPVTQFGPIAGPVQYQIKNPDPFPTEYAYQVQVFTGSGKTFGIDHCPLVDDSN